MSERRNLEHVTHEGRGVIHTRWASDEYRNGWERTFGKKRKGDGRKGLQNSAVEEGRER